MQQVQWHEGDMAKTLFGLPVIEAKPNDPCRDQSNRGSGFTASSLKTTLESPELCEPAALSRWLSWASGLAPRAFACRRLEVAAVRRACARTGRAPVVAPITLSGGPDAEFSA
jgi:hypothetical protein